MKHFLPTILLCAMASGCAGDRPEPMIAGGSTGTGAESDADRIALVGNAAASSPAEGGAPFSIDSALTLFRLELPEVTELHGGAPTATALVERFVAAVEQSDTTALRDLMMDRAEFAYLYYPTSPSTRAPTKQEPNLVWFLHIQASQKGATRLLNRYGGKSLAMVDSECNTPPRQEGENVLWDDCVQRLIVKGDTVTTRLFGGIYERQGSFKIFSYANDM